MRRFNTAERMITPDVALDMLMCTYRIVPIARRYDSSWPSNYMDDVNRMTCTKFTTYKTPRWIGGIVSANQCERSLVNVEDRDRFVAASW